MKTSFLFSLMCCASLGNLFAQSGETTYKNYCAGCHGAQLQGSTAGALIKTDWKYGRGRGAIMRNIRFGIPGTEMIAWGKVIPEKDITALADYIVAAQEVAPNAIRPVPAKLTTRDYVLKVEKLVDAGISTPWGIEFTDARHALITERTGGLRWMVDGKLDPRPIEGLPATYSQRTTGGLMDIALDPDHARNGWIYLAFSHTKGNPADKNVAGMTKIVRGKIRNYRWTAEEVLFEVHDSLKIPGGNRWGGRLMFDTGKMLYFSIGDMARAADAQNPGKPSGKVFRIHADGSIPKDNPFLNDERALPALFSLGNRNVQGLAQHPETGEIWATEHGPMGGDELNILKKGRNYGWPRITYGVDYDGAIVSNDTVGPGMEQPVVYWTPSIAVCSAEFVTGTLFPKWKHDLLVGALAFEEIRRVVIDKNKVSDQEVILKGVGRVRDLKIGPDGALYMLLNDPDMVLRITPDQ